VIGTETEDKIVSLLKEATASLACRSVPRSPPCLLELSLARRPSPPRALPGPSAVAPSIPHWPPLPGALNGRSSCRRRSRVLVAAKIPSFCRRGPKKSGEREDRRHVLYLLSSHPSSCRRRTSDFASVATLVYQRESEKTGHSLGPSVFFFFACGEGAKRLQPQVVELIRQILPDVVSHRFRGNIPGIWLSIATLTL
jgi:hypothetical protein